MYNIIRLRSLFIKRIIYLSLSLIFLFSCGPDCPTCPDESGGLGISPEHWEILECAGFDEYVRDNVRCAYYPDEIISKDGYNTTGMADCSCNDIHITTYDAPLIETYTIIHETAHLERGCDNEEYANEKEHEFGIIIGNINCFED